MRALLLAMAFAACAPVIDGPVEHQRALDRDDAVALSRQLSALPGAVRAEVTLHRAVRDPLANDPPAPAGAAAIVIVDDQADRIAVRDAALRLVHAAAPEIPEPSIVIELGATRPELASIGPFTVAASSKRGLVAALAIALAVIAALAGFIAFRERPRSGAS